MVLGPGQILGAERCRIKTLIDIAVKGQKRRACSRRPRLRRPGLESVGVECGQTVAHVHELGERGRAQRLEQRSQCSRLVFEYGVGHRHRRKGGRKVETLGWRENHQHRNVITGVVTKTGRPRCVRGRLQQKAPTGRAYESAAQRQGANPRWASWPSRAGAVHGRPRARADPTVNEYGRSTDLRR